MAQHNVFVFEDPREDVGVGVDVGVVECGLYPDRSSYRYSHFLRPRPVSATRVRSSSALSAGRSLSPPAHLAGRRYSITSGDEDHDDGDVLATSIHGASSTQWRSQLN